MSDASRTRLLIRPETAWAENPPANAPTTRLRFTGENLGIRKTTVLSDEIRSDRQRTDMPLVGIDAAGDINMEAIYGAEFDLILQAALCGAWGTPSANNLRNGVTNRSFGIEAGFLDIAKYIYFRGCIPSKFALDIAARQIVKVSTSWMGQRGVPAGTSIAGTTTPTEPTANAPMKAGSGISILDSGTANEEFAGVTARRITIDIANTLRARELATSEYGAEPGRSVMEITGTIETYFDDIVRYQAFLANAFFAAKFRITDLGIVAAANTYEFTLPTMKISDAPVEIPGNEADIMQTFSWRALLDPAVGYAMNVERGIVV